MGLLRRRKLEKKFKEPIDPDPVPREGEPIRRPQINEADGWASYAVSKSNQATKED